MVTHTHQLDDGADRQDAHDALAELFLGELRTVAAHDAAMGLPPRPSTQHWLGNTGPDHTQPPSHVHAGHAHTAHPVPTPAASPPNAPRPESRALNVERVLAGHLPLGTAPWITHHARVAAQEGPVALVRASAGHLRVDLFGASASLDSVTTTTPRSALMAAAQEGARVMVVAEHEAIPGEARLTLLMGADEAAVVDGYRRLKDLAAGAAGLSVAVVGANPAKAAAAFERLREAAQRFLGVRLRSAGAAEHYEQVTGGPLPRTLYHGPCAESTVDLLAGIAQTVRHVRRPETPAADTRRLVRDETTAPALREHDLATNAMAEPAPPVESAGTLADETARWAQSPQHPQLLLASHLQGFTTIAARCPATPTVEFAVDRSGRLHALAARWTDGPAEDSRSAVESLAAATAWANTNMAVLALTMPDGRGLDVGADPVQHLFTRQPVIERGLLDSPIRIHVIAGVDRMRSPDWVCVELN